MLATGTKEQRAALRESEDLAILSRTCAPRCRRSPPPPLVSASQPTLLVVRVRVAVVFFYGAIGGGKKAKVAVAFLCLRVEIRGVRAVA